MTRPRRADAGFTLIEALIALAVLAITAVSFLRATEANVARVSTLEARTAASWVAQNRLAELTLGLQAPDGPVKMMGQDFAVTVTTTATNDPTLVQVEITATPSVGGTGAALIGFVLRRVGDAS